MSSMVQDAGGFVVISEVRPQNDQGKGPEEGWSCNAPAALPKPLVAFYRGEPEVLGTTQIFSGILLISIGIAITSVFTTNFVGILIVSGILLWSGILFIISGSLSVAASVKPTTGKVKSSLVMNIFCSLASACGIILTALDISLVGVIYSPAMLTRSYCAYHKPDMQCRGDFTPLTFYYGVLSFILLLFMLIFCIAISTSVFACKTVCRTSFHEMTVVIYQTTSMNVTDAARNVPPDTAALTSDLKAQT
ncbi:hypothetical protein GDO81_025659 [Engystomops pustulosus]|uniref:Membrane-spanning 4-domains subfamily A member 4A-like n=1 Tax=Engystomops pustulosus TaxID=76066 RepID=A0AAV6ZQU6_ENGPU|nr:hypothetical protein GDO81_025659 [Engystomops pustulosus]KAG8548368.1 hypothetical protein GDO81_025659 [Engystomops pustulosus]KAG8548369.1 hypothetical protein GDO81_025659 [Engystomops pustulosus]